MMSSDHGVNLDETRQPNIIVCDAILWGFAALLTALRLYTRGWLTRTIGAEDWVILLALLFSTALSAATIYQVTKGLGLRMQRISLDDWASLRFGGWLSMMFNALSLYLTKISILLLYSKIFTRRIHRIAIYTAAAIVVGAFVYSLTIIFLACRPLRGFWEPASQTCLAFEFWIAYSVLHLGTDIMVTVLPLPIIFDLKMHRREKFVLVFLFALGFWVSLVSFLRLYYSLTGLSDDPAWSSIIVTYWTSIEVDVAIICASLMTLKPLVQKYAPKLLSSRVSLGQHHFEYPRTSAVGVQDQSTAGQRRSGTTRSRITGGDSVDDLIYESSSQSVVGLTVLAKAHSEGYNHAF